MDWGQSQILVTLVPFLNVDATKLIKIGKSLITSGKKRTGQSQILDTHTSLLNVDDICSIKIVKQLITSGTIKNGPKSTDRGYWSFSLVLYMGEERGCFVTAPSFMKRIL